MNTLYVDHEALVSYVTAIFTATGATEPVAVETAQHLVEANLKGHDSHGIGMIPHYVQNIDTQLLKVGAHATIARDNGAVMVIDGGFGFGQVVGREATEIAIERVRETGIVCAAVRNNHHLGRIGHYGELCGNAGLVSIHFVNVVGHEPQVSPWGGRERRMTTNPFCCVIPRAGAAPVVLDMATSAIALGKVRVAASKGVDVDEGVLVDHTGAPTTDPLVMFSEPMGALGPFGKHKGYGLAVACELLGGALAGRMDGTARARPQYQHRQSHAHVRRRSGGVRRPGRVRRRGTGNDRLPAQHGARGRLRPCPRAGRTRARNDGRARRERYPRR